MKALAYSRLEARRNLALYAGWPAVIALSVPLCAWLAAQAGIPAAQGTGAALLAWMAGGLPISAALFGAVAGAGLRGAAEEQEAALPVSPRARIGGALVSAAAGLALCAALVAGLTAVLSPEARDIAASSASISGFGGTLSRGSSEAAASLMMGWVMAVSCAVAYAAEHAVLGAVAGLLGAAVVLAPIGADFLLQNMFDGVAAHLTPAVFWLAACGSGAAAALAAAARLPAVSRRRWWPRLAAVALLPFAGAPGAWHSVFSTRERLLEAIEAKPAYFYQVDEEYHVGLGGRLTLRRPGGPTVVLLAGQAPSLADLLRRKLTSEVGTVVRDRGGRVWASVWNAGTGGALSFYDVWQGDGRGPLTRYMTLPPGMSLERDGDHAAVNTYDGSLDSRGYVTLDAARPPPPLKRK